MPDRHQGNPTGKSTWTAQQVSQLLGTVATTRSPYLAVRAITEAVEAPFGLLVIDGELITSVRPAAMNPVAPRGDARAEATHNKTTRGAEPTLGEPAPDLALLAATQPITSPVPLPGYGTVHVLDVQVGEHRGDRLLIARPTQTTATGRPGAFDRDDQALVKSLARVLRLARDLHDRVTADHHDNDHDPLTGLPNRRLIIDRLEQAQRRAARGPHDPAVIFVDLNRFKTVNDTLGHAAGDQVLREIARRLTAICRSCDTVGRLAGDEFILIVENLDRPSVLTVSRRIAASVAEPVRIAEIERTVTASHGIAFADPLTAPEDVLRNAGVATYEAKSATKTDAVLFGPEMHRRLSDQVEMEQDLREAIRQGDLTVDYQPLVDVTTRRVTGVEALARWRRRGITVSPEIFVELAERCGLMNQLGDLILQQACCQISTWRAEQPGLGDLNLSVNMSGSEFEDPRLLERVEFALAISRLPGAALTIELTETALMADLAASASRIGQLAELEVSLAIDDFGTGYSSLAYLQQLPVSLLKIDRSFITNIDGGKADRSIVESIISLARGVGVEVMAEGVEKTAQLTVLRELGCELAQGFYFARPCSADQALPVLLDRTEQP